MHLFVPIFQCRGFVSSKRGQNRDKMAQNGQKISKNSQNWLKSEYFVPKIIKLQKRAEIGDNFRVMRQLNQCRGEERIGCKKVGRFGAVWVAFSKWFR